MGPLGAVPREPRRWVDEAMATGDGTGRSVCFSVPPGGVPVLRQGRHTRSRLSLLPQRALPVRGELCSSVLPQLKDTPIVPVVERAAQTCMGRPEAYWCRP